MDNEEQAAAAANKDRLWRFALGIWSGAWLVAAVVPGPYGLVTVVLATCLHFAALEGQ